MSGDWQGEGGDARRKQAHRNRRSQAIVAVNETEHEELCRDQRGACEDSLGKQIGESEDHQRYRQQRHGAPGRP